MGSSWMRHGWVSLSVLMVSLALAGCPGSGSSSGGGSSSKSLDGVYHGGAITLTIKDKKATVEMGGESKTLDYKVEGNKLTLLDPKEGDAVFTINDDGTLSGQLGEMKKG